MARETIASLNKEIGTLRSSNGSLQRDSKYLRECKLRAEDKWSQVTTDLRRTESELATLRNELKRSKMVIQHLTAAVTAATKDGTW